MSSYINFYIKNHSNNSYTPLQSLSRSSTVYKIAYDCGITGTQDTLIATPISLETFDRCISEALEMQRKLENSRADENNLKASILQCNNSIEEKLVALSDIQCTLNDIEEQFGDINYSLQLFRFLRELAEDAPYSYGDKSYERSISDETIYGGIEASAPDTPLDESCKEE